MKAAAFVCVCLALCSTPTAAAGISIRDDLGHAVALGQPAQRIVTLAPFLTELVFSAGAGARLVAVSTYSDYPERAKALPQVANAAGFSMEQVLALRPDLVLAWRDSIRIEDAERLRSFGIAVFVAQARSLEDVPRLLAAVGALAGSDTAAQARAYREKLAALRSAHASLPRLAVLLEVWHRPLQTVAGQHWMNEALEICGATNAFADLPGVAPLLSWEEVYARDPRAIVGAGSAGSEKVFRSQWNERSTLFAVRQKRLVYLSPDIIQRPTLRLTEGVEQLCAGLDRAR